MAFHVCSKQKQTVDYKTPWNKIFHKINFGVVTTVHHNKFSTETHDDSEFYQESTSAEKKRG